MNDLNNIHDTKCILDEETGEITYITNKEYAMVMRSKDNHFKGVGGNNIDEFKKSDSLFHQYIDETCGNFYFNYYSKHEINQYTFRFLYICTKMNYDGYVELGNAKKDGRLATKKDLFEILNISERECYRTVNYLFENKLIELDGDFIKINSDFSVKGEIKNKKEVVRMFNKAIEEIYLNSLAKEHKKLSLLIKILPYIHFRFNVVCVDSREEYIEKVVPYSLTGLANLLGYSTAQKLKKGLMELKVNNEPVVMLAKINNREMIVVNPKIYYKGNDLDDVQGIVNLFKIAK